MLTIVKRKKYNKKCNTYTLCKCTWDIHKILSLAAVPLRIGAFGPVIIKSTSEAR